jgi:hypothetical protein
LRFLITVQVVCSIRLELAANLMHLILFISRGRPAVYNIALRAADAKYLEVISRVFFNNALLILPDLFVVSRSV